MDAVKYLECCDRIRICDDITFSKLVNRTSWEQAVEIVESWSNEHPIKTRQSEFLKLYPHVKLDELGVIDIDPCNLEPTLYKQYAGTCKCLRLGEYGYSDCRDCRAEYWSKEVE